MMMHFLLIAQMISSRPPLSPEEAVNVLRASRSIADHTEALTAPIQPTRDYEWGSNSSGIYVLNSHTGDGPFGAFPAYPEPINQAGWLFTTWTGRHRYEQRFEHRTFQPRTFITPPIQPTPPVHNVMAPARAGGAVRRR
jgi:hypothetical protein